MSEEPHVLTSVDTNGIARIVFNRPHARNAATREMMDGMREFLKRIEHDPAVRVIVMEGAGEHFMAGGDVKGFGQTLDMPPAERKREFENRISHAAMLFTVMERLEKPVIAKVRGACAGASVGWVAASDFALVSDNALFVVANTLIGASPDGGVSWHLPRIVGLRKAKEMAMLGDRLSAQEAVDAGLGNWLVPDAELDERTEKLALKLSRAASFAVGRAKAMLNASSRNSLHTQLQFEAESFAACAATDDFAEGITAFTEKRKPAFKGL